jgi:alanine racemase
VIGNEELLQGNVPDEKRFSWSKKGAAAVQVGASRKKAWQNNHHISHAANFFKSPYLYRRSSIENAITCSCVLLYLKVDIETKAAAFSNLHAVDMRLHLMRGINNCTLINDSYSADLTSLHIALGFLQQQATAQKRTVVLSDFIESGKTDEALYQHVASLVRRYKIEKLIGIGEKSAAFLPALLPEKTEAVFYKSTEQFVQQFRSSFSTTKLF